MTEAERKRSDAAAERRRLAEQAKKDRAEAKERATYLRLAEKYAGGRP